jgi:hypothetical protein
MRKTIWMLLGLSVLVLSVGCGGQRSDKPAANSEAAESLVKGIPAKGTEQGSKPAPTPEATP